MVLVAGDIVEKDFLSLARSVSALEAARLMKSSRQGFIVVVASDGHPEGIVTEWDYLSKLIAEGKDPGKVKLEEIMSVNLVTVRPNDEIDYVSQLMFERGIRRVLVVKEGKVLGIITARTMLARMREYIDRVSSQIARLQAPNL